VKYCWNTSRLSCVLFVQAYRGSLERKSSQSVHSQEAKACPDLFYERIKTDTPKKTSTILQNVHLHRVDREYFVGPMTPIFHQFLGRINAASSGLLSKWVNHPSISPHVYAFDRKRREILPVTASFMNQESMSSGSGLVITANGLRALFVKHLDAGGSLPIELPGAVNVQRECIAELARSLFHPRIVQTVSGSPFPLSSLSLSSDSFILDPESGDKYVFLNLLLRKLGLRSSDNALVSQVTKTMYSSGDAKVWDARKARFVDRAREHASVVVSQKGAEDWIARRFGTAVERGLSHVVLMIFKELDWQRVIKDQMLLLASALQDLSDEQILDPDIEVGMDHLARAWGRLLRVRAGRFAENINDKRKELQKYTEALKHFTNQTYLTTTDPISVAMAKSISAETKEGQNLLINEIAEQRTSAGVVTFVDSIMAMAYPKIVTPRGYLLAGNHFLQQQMPRKLICAVDLMQN